MGREKVNRGRLREETALRAGSLCEWAGCVERGEEMAHLLPSGMGGSLARDVLTNTAWLCRWHHDIFDGRRSQGTKEATRILLTDYLRRLDSAAGLRDRRGG